MNILYERDSIKSNLFDEATKYLPLHEVNSEEW